MLYVSYVGIWTSCVLSNPLWMGMLAPQRTARWTTIASTTGTAGLSTPFKNSTGQSRGGVDYPTGHDECDKLILAQNSRSYGTNFTHGDLSLRHVYYLNGRITGIIDWESAGWFPDYWEYAMAWDSFWDSPDFRNDISQFLAPFPAEQKMEETRRKLFRGA